MRWFLQGRLPSARQKLARAHEHIKSFELILEDFLRENPPEVMTYCDDDGFEETRFVLDTSIPKSLAWAAGDALHNLRCALDHLAYAVALSSGIDDEGLRGISFPARNSKKAFEKAIATPQVVQMGDAWLSFLREIEPYVDGKSGDLYVVTALDNIDKHRELLIIDVLADTFLWNEPQAVFVPVQHGLSFVAGVDLALDKAHPAHHTHTQTRVSFGESIPGLDEKSFANVLLRNLAETVSQTLQNAIQNQDLWPRRYRSDDEKVGE